MGLCDGRRTFALVCISALTAAPVAASTIDPTYVTNTRTETNWAFGKPLPARSAVSARSTVDLIGSDDCETATAGNRCLLFEVAYRNAVNFGAGAGNESYAEYTNAALGIHFGFGLDVVRTTNRRCGALGCPDRLALDLGNLDDRVTASGNSLTLAEDTQGSLFFYTRLLDAGEVSGAGSGDNGSGEEGTPPLESGGPSPEIAPVPLPPASGLLGMALIACGGVAGRGRRIAG